MAPDKLVILPNGRVVIWTGTTDRALYWQDVLRMWADNPDDRNAIVAGKVKIIDLRRDTR